MCTLPCRFRSTDETENEKHSLKALSREMNQVKYHGSQANFPRSCAVNENLSLEILNLVVLSQKET